jgi:rubrerythrin
MNPKKINELLYQALETERGGVNIYRTALRCVQNEQLREVWEKYLEQTENHERILLEVFEQLELDPVTDTPGRAVVRHVGQSLVKAIEMALKEGEPADAEIVAAECIVQAETKEHMNWELLGECAKKLKGEAASAIKDAHDEVEDEEDEHLYHTTGWTRELWMAALGMKALLPPPEETQHVKSAAGAARAKQSRARKT